LNPNVDHVNRVCGRLSRIDPPEAAHRLSGPISTPGPRCRSGDWPDRKK